MKHVTKFQDVTKLVPIHQFTDGSDNKCANCSIKSYKCVRHAVVNAITCDSVCMGRHLCCS